MTLFYNSNTYCLECQDCTSHELDDSGCMKIMGKFLLLISSAFDTHTSRSFILSPTYPYYIEMINW